MKKLNLDKETLISLLDKQYTNEQLAAYFECSTGTIKRRKKEFDLVGYKTNKKPLTDKELQKLETLSTKGVGFGKACKEIGKAQATVRKYIPNNIHKQLNANGMINLKEHHRKATFENMLKPSKESAYILGYLVTDGNISAEGAISATSKDKELIQHCANFFGSAVNTMYKEDKIYYTFTAKDHRYMEKFKKVTNLKPNKTYTCYIIPEWVYDYIEDFIIGVFNGDGWAYQLKDRNTCEIGIVQHINQLPFLEELNKYLDWDIYSGNNSSYVLKTKKISKVSDFSKVFCNNPFSLSRKAEILLRYSLAL